MGRYNFDEIGGFWGDRAKKIVENGVFVAHSGNWDLWLHDDFLYDIPIAGSGCDFSHYCAPKDLYKHLFHLRQVCKYDPLIPPMWENVNYEFLKTLGIA